MCIRDRGVRAPASSGPVVPPQRRPVAPTPVAATSAAPSSAPGSAVRLGGSQAPASATAQTPAPAAPFRQVQSPPAASAVPPAVRPPLTAPVAGPVETALQALQAEPAPQPAQRTPAVAARTTAAPAPIPFDATLGTILYSAERKLAIVNGRIVGIGDDVNGARIVDITATTVLLRDARNRMRILTLGQGSAPSAQ